MTDMEVKAEELARALDAFANELDPYGYMDAVDDPEGHIRSLKDSLMSGDAVAIRPVREYLREAAEDSDEYQGRAEELLDRLDQFPDGKRASVLDRLAELRTGIVPVPGRRKEEMAI
jgi:hypothetical protein